MIYQKFLQFELIFVTLKELNSIMELLLIYIHNSFLWKQSILRNDCSEYHFVSIGREANISFSDQKLREKNIHNC